MWIKNIKLVNFRNYEKQEINFKKNINIFYGENAQGKTNIIESIFLCSLGKSFRTNKDNEMIKFNEEDAIIEINYQKKDREGNIKIELGKKKNIFVNGVKIKKLSELLGNLNIVIFKPDDINVLRGAPEDRRKFLNMMISQLRPNYAHILNLYLKTLLERNKYLKEVQEKNNLNESLLEVYDEKLVDYGMKIYNYRKEFIEKISEKIPKIHNKITDGKEDINIKYISECDSREKYFDILKQRRKLDIIRGSTTKGIHRDDFVIYIDNKEVNIYGSQGQNRTAILSLKLSELQVIYDEIGEYPVLLLDDFMSELDDKRRENFLNNIYDTQVIITGTEKINIEKNNFLEYNVKSGKVIKD